MSEYQIEIEINEKVIDPEGVTTEFVRCIDPTASGIVVKVIRTRISESE